MSRGLPCYLQLLASGDPVNAFGNPLDIQYAYRGSTGLTFDALAMLGLSPGRTAGFGFQRENWCMPAIQGGVSIRLAVPQDGGSLTIPTGLTAGGVCDDSASPSWVGISPLSIP